MNELKLQEQKLGTVKVFTRSRGWVDGAVVRFLPKRVLVRLDDGKVIIRRRSEIEMDDLAKAIAIAYDLRV